MEQQIQITMQRSEGMDRGISKELWQHMLR